MKKLTALALTCVLLVGVFFGTAIFTSADDVDPIYNVNAELDVAGLNEGNFNVEYQGFMHLAVEIENTDNGLTNGIFVYSTEVDPAMFAYTEPLYKTFTVKESPQVEGDPIKYCATQGIAAKDIDLDYRIVAVSYDKVNDQYKFGEFVDYSIADYCNTQIDRHDNHDPETGENPISDAQYTLYKSILAYGEAAKEILK